MNINICLQPLDSKDIGLARSWRNDWRVWQWCRQPDFISDTEQVQWFNRQAADPTIRMYKIVAERDEAKPAPVGVCGLTSISHLHRTSEFSLYVAPEAQGRGLGTNALKLLLAHGFNNLGLNVIWGETFAGNPAARIFEKLGFVKEGTRRQLYWKDGRQIDAHLYSILAEEWRARSANTPGADDRPATGAGLPDVLQKPA